MATLTLLDGDAQQTFESEEHPIEVARKALLAAAEIESEILAPALRRAAAALPQRDGPLVSVKRQAIAKT